MSMVATVPVKHEHCRSRRGELHSILAKSTVDISSCLLPRPFDSRWFLHALPCDVPALFADVEGMNAE
jgi:hypothetical protein